MTKAAPALMTVLLLTHRSVIATEIYSAGVILQLAMVTVAYNNNNDNLYDTDNIIYHVTPYWSHYRYNLQQILYIV